MASKAIKHVKRELKMDMTPMIDCVFLLMIFFVLVIDLSQKELEDLILPKAEFSEPDDSPPEFRPIANVLQDGRIVYKRETYYDPDRDKDSFERIKTLTEVWRDDTERYYLAKGMSREEIAQQKIKKEKVGGGAVLTVIDEPVLIRADKWTEWYFVGKFMEQCTNPKAAFWKLELALSEEDKEAKMMGTSK